MWEQQDAAIHRTKWSLHLSATGGNGCMHLLATVHFMKAEKGSFQRPHFPEVLKGETAKRCEQEGTLPVGCALLFVE